MSQAAAWLLKCFHFCTARVVVGKASKKKSIKRKVRAAAVRLYGQVLQRKEGNILKTLNFEVIGSRKDSRLLAKNRPNL